MPCCELQPPQQSAPALRSAGGGGGDGGDGGEGGGEIIAWHAADQPLDDQPVNPLVLWGIRP